ncbi:hypothetical protein BDN70DRAFT_345318 [Pholiota conissans]|uniref:Uncharacterized protein n=1 Tax=Pholiota conissans TaxID=109636 RepID=A0A9P6CNZ3_9AGAR|nr:hypothetical protein BDN70DRAFT_345318 [Pholiota conissans]
MVVKTLKPQENLTYPSAYGLHDVHPEKNMQEKVQSVESKVLVGIPLPTLWFQQKRRSGEPEAFDKHEKTKANTTVLNVTATSDTSSTSTRNRTPSTFPELHFTYSRTKILLYACFLLLCNLIIPCILFYPLVSLTTLSPKAVIGISSAALGISSCFDTPMRLYRLVRYRREFGPLGNDTWWYLDFSMWIYTVALLIFAIPLAIAPAIPLFNFFLMSTVMLVGPVALVFLVSLFRPTLPFRCSSDPPGERMKPAVFYLIEDVAAVDFQHGREFRQALHDRWHASVPFQNLVTQLTLYWTLSAAIYCGATAAVSWSTSLNFAFAWTLGQLFVWARLSALGSHILTKRGLKKEREWWANEHPNEVREVTPKDSS